MYIFRAFPSKLSKILAFRAVWYMCLKTEICCFKTFVEIHVSEKVCGNT